MTQDEEPLDEAQAEVAELAAKEALDRAETIAADAKATEERHGVELREAKAALAGAFERGAPKEEITRLSANRLTAEAEIRAAEKAAARANGARTEAEENHRRAGAKVTRFSLERRKDAILGRLHPEYVRQAELIAGALASAWKLAAAVDKVDDRWPVPRALISPDFLSSLALPRLRTDPLRERLGDYWN